MSEGFAQYAEQVFARCDILGHISQTPSIVDRRYLTEEHKRANQQVAKWMQQAGMQTWQDAAGNQWGRFPSNAEDAPVLVMGSHLDTVPNGGKYDGMLGVIAPISLCQSLFDRGVELPFHIDIVGFGDEEGVRFSSTLLGSRAVAGQWNPAWNGFTDEDGITVRHAFGDFGLDVDKVADASRVDDNIMAFVELHIEQGPVLEQANLPVGVVTSIAGARRFQVTVTGKAGHAGTVPMKMRQDALVAASEMVMAVDQMAKAGGITATVGRLETKPGAVNVIPGQVVFTLDVRSESDVDRDAAVTAIQEVFATVTVSRGVGMSMDETHCAQAVHCDPRLQATLADAIAASDLEVLRLYSGAGHDAMAMAECWPSVMLFMRCDKGISHHPAEAVSIKDIEHSLVVMEHFVRKLR